MSEQSMQPVEPIYLIPGPKESGDRVGIAVDSSGHAIYSHVSSSHGWAIHDLSHGVRRTYGLDLPEDDTEMYDEVNKGERLIVTDDPRPVPRCEGCGQCEVPDGE